MAETAIGLCPWLADDYERLDSARSRGLLGHAWLLAGSRGIGKGLLARALAASLLSAGRLQPSLLDAKTARAAMQAQREESDHHADLHLVFPAADKNTIVIEQVREAISAVELTSLGGIGKVLIVEPAEAMTTSAANALLKTLEEPTADTYFFLVSHQPGLLPPTVRSRCQLLRVPLPPADVALSWLGEAVADPDRGGLGALLALAGGAPLRTLELYEADFININNELESTLDKISRNQADPLEVAEQWHKGDSEIYLSWLAGRLETAIKARLAPDASTPVTDPAGDRLHNAWGSLTLKGLFDRLGETRALLTQLGSAVNAELALRVLLLGFRPGSSRT